MKSFKMGCSLAIAAMLSFSSLAMAQDNVTKLDFVKMALDTGKIEVSKKDDNMSYVESAFKNKVLTGDIKSFKLDDKLTKEQAIIVLIRALGEEGIAKKINDENLIKDIKDKKDISTWAKPYIMYAAKNGIIDANANLNPKALISDVEAKDMMTKAKTLYDTTLTREGLTATKMLDEANKKLLAYKTYKFNGKMTTTGKVKMPEGEEPINMDITMDGSIQNPETVYVKMNMVAKDKTNKEEKASSETYIKDRVIYTKVEGSDKWMKLDMNPMMQEMEKIMGKGFNSGTFSKDQLEMFGMYAKYDKDATVEGKDYYVVSIDVDKNSFKTVFKDMMNKIANANVDMAMKNTEVKKEEINKEEIKKGIEQMLNSMDIEIGYKIYVNKADKTYGKTLITENITMNMKPIVTEMIMNGEFKYLDFDKEVKFPEIKDSDIQKIDLQK